MLEIHHHVHIECEYIMTKIHFRQKVKVHYFYRVGICEMMNAEQQRFRIFQGFSEWFHRTSNLSAPIRAVSCPRTAYRWRTISKENQCWHSVTESKGCQNFCYQNLLLATSKFRNDHQDIHKKCLTAKWLSRWLIRARVEIMAEIFPV